MSTRNEKGEIVFDTDEQKKLDEIIQDRVSRVKAEKPGDYDDLQGMINDLKAMGYTGTPAEIRATIKKQQDQAKAARDQQEAVERAQRNGTTPEQEMEIQRLKTEQENIKAKLLAREKTEEDENRAQEEQRKAKEKGEKYIADFEGKYPDVDWEKLYADPKFKRFIKGKEVSLIEAYEDYTELMGEAETTAFVKARNKENRSTGGGNSGGGSDYGMTGDDKRALDGWNKRYPKMAMTPKEWMQRK